jgi:hypothetical protein
LLEQRWEDLGYHDESVGCLFDFCEQHRDLVAGLKRMKFDHPECRNQINDPEQLAAIDALLATDIVETSFDQSDAPDSTWESGNTPSENP